MKQTQIQIRNPDNLKLKKKNERLKLKKLIKTQIVINLIENQPKKFLNPIGLIKIFKDFYLSFSDDNINYNLDNFPLYNNNALTVTTIDNLLHISNNGKRFPCLTFNVTRRQLPWVPIGLIYERLVSKNDSIAKEVADKILKINEIMNTPNIMVRPEQLTTEEEQYKLKYQYRLQNLLIDLDTQGKYFCVITHEQDKKGDLTLTKITLNKKLMEVLTNQPDNFILDSLKNGIPSFFGIKNLYKLYLNVFKHLMGVPLKNYGIFFNLEEFQDEMVLQNCYGELINVNCKFYNTFILTKNYHERNLIRCFSPLNEKLVLLIYNYCLLNFKKFQKPEFLSCSYKTINSI